MRIEQLEYLDAIVRSGSMRRAGEELHLSQPALSESVRNLERELGVTLLERRRTGAKISVAGRELLPYLSEVLEAVERLRTAAGDHGRVARTVRIGTVNAATVPIVAPAISDFRRHFPDAQVEVVSAQQADIREALLDGSMDLGLVNLMAGDGIVPDLKAVELLRGRAVVCCRPDAALAKRDVVTTEELLAEPFVFMRPGYAMHRFMQRLFDTRRPAVSFAADGAEMGKTMVAEGLGVTVLPDYSVVGDPLERAGIITHRPLAPGPRTDDLAGAIGVPVDDTVVLVLQSRPAVHRSPVILELERALRARAAAHPAGALAARALSPTQRRAG